MAFFDSVFATVEEPGAIKKIYVDSARCVNLWQKSVPMSRGTAFVFQKLKKCVYGEK